MTKEDSERIEERAAGWLAKRDSGSWSGADQAELEAWLRTATAHRIAFVRLEAAWWHADRLKALGAGIKSGTMPPPGKWRLSPFFDRLQSASSSQDLDEDAESRNNKT